MLFGHGGDFFAEEPDAALIGTEQSVGEFEQNAFADAGGSEQDAGLAWSNRERDVFEDGRPVEGDGDVVKGEDRLCFKARILPGGRALTGPMGIGQGWLGLAVNGCIHRGGKRASSSWVRRKSTKMMSTEALTTA